MDQFVSKALDENLRATHVPEIILDEQARALLDRSRAYYGINQRLKACLEELYHPYANPGIVLSLMRASILGDLWWFVKQEDFEELFKDLLGFYQRAEKLCVKRDQLKKLLGDYLELLLALASQVESKLPDQAITLLQKWMSEHREIFLLLSSTAKKTLVNLAARACEERLCFDILKGLLLDNLSFWQRTVDLEAWLTGLESPPPAEQAAHLIHPSALEAWTRDCENAESMDDLQHIPAQAELAALYRDGIGTFADLTTRVQYIFFLLSLPGMADLMDHLLWDLNRQLSGLYKELSDAQVLHLIDGVFDTLEQFRATHAGIVLDCLLTLGKTVLVTSGKALKRHLIDKITALGFTPPGPVKISTDWQTQVDKNHVKHLRILLELIKINPADHKDLLAFTIISLTRNGVFISDTDLFQKDVSGFLGSEIMPVFVQTKHLLRNFPVFYMEIGAEGEIRDASTALDELFQRKDRLIHFLRKQVHTESNNTHITLIEKILGYWVDLDPTPLQTMVPEDVWAWMKDLDQCVKAQHSATLGFLQRHQISDTQLLELSWQRVNMLFEDELQDVYTKRLKLLAYCHFLLKDKYNLDPYDIVKFLARYPFFDTKEQNRLRSSLIRHDYDSSIRQMLSYIGRLNTQILDPKPTDPWENIYYKRHIAAGIPSMYGTYKEPKLEAMGMVFRLENVIRRLFERSIEQLNLNYINGKTMRRIVRILRLYDYAMRQEMVTSEAFSSAVAMLDSVHQVSNLSLDQYLDIFHLIKDSINEIINEYYYRFYDYQLERMNPSGTDQARAAILAEEFYRRLISASFLVQGLDSFVIRILASLDQMRKLFSQEGIRQLMSYDPDRLFFHLFTRNSRIENQVLLGSKAFFLKRMHQYEFPIPPGFVITTDLFRNRKIINTHPDVLAEFDQLLQDNLHRLEQHTGMVFGDASKPLLLSVRSGAPMSLPGAMDTFLNIGLNDEITQSLSDRNNYGWTAWDCYRRLIQSWGMAYGIPRDEFDAVMIQAKKRYKVQLKSQFSPLQMKEMVQDYQDLLIQHSVHFEQDPFQQLYTAIGHVLDSWDTPRAQLYRSKLHIADEWGTAVIIQKMVLGNISLDSGTGVVFTHADWHHEPGICLNGDFTLCSQGEDIVAGLVHTLPISEQERLRQKCESSLEKDFPAIFQGLQRYTAQLINERHYPHQEMEFTFEGPGLDQLYVLQTRNQVIQKSPEYQVLDSSEASLNKIGSGIGIGKGAVCGIIVISMEDIERFKGTEKLILVRPDTVPEDMALLFECQGLLTSRGGVSSHAAVTANRLGITGIVNCKDLVVYEKASHCRIGNTKLVPGDKISLDATGGVIYLGHYPLQSIMNLA